MKRPILILLIICIAAIGAWLWHLKTKSLPPKESYFIQNFHDHRAAFERLREMLEADKQLVKLGGWGVSTESSLVPLIPPKGDFPETRYREYLALLKEAGGRVVYRGRGEQANPGIGLWAWGFAGNTRHVGISWLDREPVGQLVATIDGPRAPSSQGKTVFRKVEGNWYLWTDI